MIKLIIFDWDDVFTLGSKEGYIKCLHDTLTDLGIRLDPNVEHERIQQTWSQPHELELANLLSERPDLVEKACEVYEQKFFGDAFVSALSSVEGANELLKRLKGHYKLAVATGAHPAILRERVMPKFQVPDVFDQIMFGYELDDSSKNKPHPYMLETILKNTGCSPAEAIFVGDAKNDVVMARNAGVEPVVVLTGHLNRQQAEELGIKHIIGDVTKLEPVLEKLTMT